MDIAIVSPNPLNQSGGVENFCHSIRDLFGSMGHDVAVVGPDFKGSADLVVSNGMVKGAIRGPRIHVYHGIWVEHMKASYRLSPRSSIWWTRRLLSGAYEEYRNGVSAYRVTVSQATARDLKHWYGLNAHQVITNFVLDMTSSRWQPHGGEHQGAFVGRVEERKNPRLAVEATRRANHRLVHVGAGMLEGANSVGIKSRPEVQDLLHHASYLIAPSRYEACSLAVLEAAAMDLPVVASRTGWILEALDAVPAFSLMCPASFDPQAWADAVRFATSESGLQVARAVGEFARATSSADAVKPLWEYAIQQATS